VPLKSDIVNRSVQPDAYVPQKDGISGHIFTMLRLALTYGSLRQVDLCILKLFVTLSAVIMQVPV
jgi:hypothetical protein